MRESCLRSCLAQQQVRWEHVRGWPVLQVRERPLHGGGVDSRQVAVAQRLQVEVLLDIADVVALHLLSTMVVGLGGSEVFPDLRCVHRGRSVSQLEVPATSAKACLKDVMITGVVVGMGHRSPVLSLSLPVSEG